MSNKELQDNQKICLEMVNQFFNLQDGINDIHIRRYAHHNIMIINQVIAISINNLIKIKNAESKNDIICIQARFINEIKNILSISNQSFLNESLGYAIFDHDAWLDAHCDLATD